MVLLRWRYFKYFRFFFVKDQNDIIYHTFIELFSLNPLLADQVF